MKPEIIVLSGYGLNCEEETKFAFELAGGVAEIVHINDLIANTHKLRTSHILAVPGGFSFGDDLGSGVAYANKLKNHLSGALADFLARDTLVIGICNGFQILTNLGFLPGALVFNDSARYIDRWVDLKVTNNISPWLQNIKQLSLPIAHGEGKYFADKKTLANIKKRNQIAAKYIKGEICEYQSLPANPNGALEDIAGLTSKDGRILGLMPHPERAISFNQLPHWTYLKEKLQRAGKPLPEHGPGIAIFKNGLEYFK